MCGRYRFWKYGKAAAKHLIDVLEGDAFLVAVEDLCQRWRRIGDGRPWAVLHPTLGLAKLLPMVEELGPIAKLKLALAERFQQVRIGLRVAAHAMILGAVPERALAGGRARRTVARVLVAPILRLKRVAKALAATGSLGVTRGGVGRVEAAQAGIWTALVEGGHLQAARHCHRPGAPALLERARRAACVGRQTRNSVVGD